MHRLLPQIALGSLLLFLVQPLMAKTLLPTHGGAAGVWTSCLVFYQCGLLGGYFYAFLMSQLPMRRQLIIHGLMLSASLLFLPIAAPETQNATSTAPEMDILLGLFRSIGLPYLLLASTSPLLQAWDSQGSADPRVFRWFAISNLGSLLGLLAYPFAIEPFTHLAQQRLGWTTGYFAYAVLVAIAMASHAIRRETPPVTVIASEADRPSSTLSWTTSRAALCVALAACSTWVLGASTTQMSQSGVVVPFLWVLPLTLYLASFVICFNWVSLARPTPWIRAFWASSYLACGLLFWGLLLPIPWQIAGYSCLVLSCAMACHAQLYALRPAPRYLTLYYLLIALGGAIGGALTGLVAPRLLSEYWEFHLGIGATAILLALCEIAKMVPRLRTDRYARNVLLPSIILTVLFIVTLLCVHFEVIRDAPIVARQRDFFGVVSVLDDVKTNRRLMLHGRTQHGAQPLAGPVSAESTLYFTRQSGVARAIEWRRQSVARPLRIGVIGLGSGSLLTHGRPGDQFAFYEISAAVDALARKHFSYLRDHQGEVTVSIGDGRQLLAKELKDHGSRQFDVLVIDAFSGDALPMHLLTLEAISLYQSHLDEGGAIAFQITNRYLDLAPILSAGAPELHCRAVVIENQPIDESEQQAFQSRVRWCLLLPNAISAEDLPDWAKTPAPPLKTVKPWTDDFGSLWSALR